MASTPPMQMLDSPRTPQTPLHGASYDHGSPRRTSARLRQKRAREDDTIQAPKQTHQSTRAPKSPRSANFELQSPQRTPQRKSNTRRVQIMSPTSPYSDSSLSKPTNARSFNNDRFFSATTTMNEGMLPTPVKTPNKKQKLIDKSNIAARALFQDQLAADEMAPSPRRNRKGKRYNGFSLESFRAEDGEVQNGIQIFTDTRDQIPEKDRDDDNPFLERDSKGVSSKKVSGTTKRRKVSERKKMDPQVEEALRDDEGMVYVFRGKKLYRRFDDAGEEEEEIDAEDLGLLEHTTDGETIVKPLKTLTRKSIRPTRLFQTEEQKRARELEKEEEATTDIDDTTHGQSNDNLNGESPQSTSKARKHGKGKERMRQADPVGLELNARTTKKRGSPFDSWVRIKPGSASSASISKPSRGKKRAASEALEESSAINA